MAALLSLLCPYPFADGRALVGLIWPVFQAELATLLHRAVVHGLEDVLVKLRGLITLKWHAHEEEGVCQTLHAQTDWSVPEIRPGIGRVAFALWAKKLKNTEKLINPT